MNKEIELICDKCKGFLIPQILSLEEIKEKLKKMNFHSKIPFEIQARAIEKDYTYFYCSICNWGKFVKNKEAEKLEKEGKKFLENKS
jgi:RNase P subunit RPR2